MMHANTTGLLHLQMSRDRKDNTYLLVRNSHKSCPVPLPIIILPTQQCSIAMKKNRNMFPKSALRPVAPNALKEITTYCILLTRTELLRIEHYTFWRPLHYFQRTGQEPILDQRLLNGNVRSVLILLI